MEYLEGFLSNAEARRTLWPSRDGRTIKIGQLEKGTRCKVAANVKPGVLLSTTGFLSGAREIEQPWLVEDGHSSENAMGTKLLTKNRASIMSLEQGAVPPCH
jgi:hypothetical protein